MRDDMDPESKMELRRHLSEIARMPKKKRKKGPRRTSQRGWNKHEIAVKALTKKLRNEFPNAEREKLVKEFKHLFENGEVPSTPFPFWQGLCASPSRFSVRKANALYLTAVIEVYAIYQYITTCGMQLEVHLKAIAEMTKHKFSSNKSTALRLIASLVIDYRLSDDSDKLDRQALSRDTLAINYLISEGVPPHKVRAYQRKHGGGVDKWSKLASGKYARDEHAIVDLAVETQELADIDSHRDYYDDSKATPEAVDERRKPTPAAIQFGFDLEPVEILVLCYQGHPKRGAIKVGELRFYAKGPLGMQRRNLEQALEHFKIHMI